MLCLVWGLQLRFAATATFIAGSAIVAYVRGVATQLLSLRATASSPSIALVFSDPPQSRSAVRVSRPPQVQTGSDALNFLYARSAYNGALAPACSTAFALGFSDYFPAWLRAALPWRRLRPSIMRPSHPGAKAVLAVVCGMTYSSVSYGLLMPHATFRALRVLITHDSWCVSLAGR